MDVTREKVAILYQANKPPIQNGIVKPMKEGGYSDSGADIGYSLQHQGILVITPVSNPNIANDFDWVFPDTVEGIQDALDKGATIIWLNTVLYSGHPIEAFIDRGIAVVGQTPESVDVYDDKWVTNDLLRSNGLPIPKSILVSQTNHNSHNVNFSFPVVAKPIRGRGSQGVSFVKSQAELDAIIQSMFQSNSYGDALYVEEFLPGQELTISVLPPGTYQISKQEVIKETHWSLSPVRRFNHQNGIAPYNGVVAVVNNSEVLDDTLLQNESIIKLCRQCELAAKLVNAKGLIRIDCRADAKGDYFLFDLNMKPNMTGASRLHRANQDSLTAIAARKIGWDFDALVLNILHQHWKK